MSAGRRVSSLADSENGEANNEGTVMFTQKKFEQLLKRLSQGNKQVRGFDTEDEIECNFTGMISSCNVATIKHAWILDAGATDHMTPILHDIDNMKPIKNRPEINLPNGNLADITHWSPKASK